MFFAKRLIFVIIACYMKKFILTGGMSLFICLYSYSQLGMFHSDEVDRSEFNNSELLNNSAIPANGSVSGFHSDGRIRYTGSVKNFRLHGNWKSWFEDNILHDEGKLVKGIPDGQWRVWYPNGNLRFIRTYSSDKLKRVKQQWLRPHPKMPNYHITILYQDNRSKATALVKSSYSFKEVKEDNSYTPAFTDCIHHGLFMNFYDDGGVKDSGYYKSGLRHGVWIESINNEDEYWTGNYSNGIKTGTWKRFNQQNRMMELIVYKKGREDWRKKY